MCTSRPSTAGDDKNDDRARARLPPSDTTVTGDGTERPSQERRQVLRQPHQDRRNGHPVRQTPQAARGGPRDAAQVHGGAPAASPAGEADHRGVPEGDIALQHLHPAEERGRRRRPQADVQDVPGGQGEPQEEEAEEEEGREVGFWLPRSDKGE